MTKAERDKRHREKRLSLHPDTPWKRAFLEICDALECKYDGVSYPPLRLALAAIANLKADIAILTHVESQANEPEPDPVPAERVEQMHEALMEIAELAGTVIEARAIAAEALRGERAAFKARRERLLDRTDPAYLARRKAQAAGLLRIQQAQAKGIPKPAVLAFKAQRQTAKQRGIPFLFSLDEWWAWWQVDGRWMKRGREHGAEGLVMARKGDAGPYSAENVYCATRSQNSTDAFAFKFGGGSRVVA